MRSSFLLFRGMADESLLLLHLLCYPRSIGRWFVLLGEVLVAPAKGVLPSMLAGSHPLAILFSA